MPPNNTFGAILIKFDTRENKGKEKELQKLLKKLVKEINDGSKPASCEQCKMDADRYCLNLQVLSCASLTGFFDYIITLRTSDIETLEIFIVSCLKGGAGKKYISETQTLAGAYFYVHGDPEETEAKTETNDSEVKETETAEAKSG